jgi:tetratricopeptide (TPR) repeat protein
MPRGPRSPHIFFGRDSELAQIIHMIFTSLGTRPAHIAILGPGGYGKSTLANAVLTHERVLEHFRVARYFVPCESIFSSGALLIELAKTLGVFDGATDTLWSRISTMLNSKDCIICLDNFESPWEQDGDTRTSVEELLSRVAETQHTTLLITMRGTARPAQTQWTKPFLPQLMTLDCDAARQVWEHIADNYDEFAEELTKAVDYVPLAVSLLAHLAQATSPQILLKLWNAEQTRFIHTGQANRQLNLEYSIQLSIDSSRMKANPPAKELLGVLSMLPDGMHIKQVERFITVLPKVNILSGICTLQECGIISVIEERYQTHPIIRNFCKNYTVISQEHKSAITDFYINLASIRYYEAKTNSYTEMVLEVNNTKAILSDLLKSDFKDHKKLAIAIFRFTEFHQSIGDFSDKLLSQTVEYLQQIDASTLFIIDCLYLWGRLHYHANNIEKAKAKLDEAEILCRTSKENASSGYANILWSLGEIYIFQNKYNEAKVSYENALKINKLNNNISGQEFNYEGLGAVYRGLNQLYEAIASYEKALELNKLTNNIGVQGDIYIGLGKTYLKLDKLNEAEASFQMALELSRVSNAIATQGNALQGLGRVQIKRLQWQDAKRLLENALALHKQAQAISDQKIDQYYLNQVLSEISQP